MAKMTEEQKQARKAQREAEVEKVRLQLLEEERQWNAGYPNRVREYRKLIAEAGLEEDINVDEMLNISVGIKYNSDYEHYANVGGIRYSFSTSPLSQNLKRWEIEDMFECLVDIIEAKETQRKYLDRVREFKKSLSPEQLSMIKDFGSV